MLCYTGAQPVFVDVDLDTMGISPKHFVIVLENNTEQQTINKKQQTIKKQPITNFLCRFPCIHSDIHAELTKLLYL
jgi:hypothetical protein